MFSRPQTYTRLPQSPESHRAVSDGGHTNLFSVWLAVISTVSLLNVLLLSYDTIRAFTTTPTHDLSKLEHRSTYIGFERLYNATNRAPEHQPIYNWPRHLSVVSSNDPELSKPQGRRYYYTDNGYIPTEVYRVTVDIETSTVAQFQVMDWGMENCQLVINPSAVNDTKHFSLIDSQRVVDIWVLEAPSDSYLKNPTWSRKPKRAKFLTSMEVSYGLESRSPVFSCPSGSMQAFEIVCPSSDPTCRMDLMHTGWKKNVLYMQQLHFLPLEAMTATKFMLTFLTVANFFILGLLQYRGRWARKSIDQVHLSCTDTDRACVWPVLTDGLVRMSVEDSVHYQLNDTPETELEWSSLFPGDGLIYLGENGRVFSVSMFHQLRCLDILRTGVVKVYQANDTKVQIQMDLTNHCLNYLRQVTLCDIDIHFDPLVGDESGTSLQSRRYHICRDWSAAYRELERNHKVHGVKF
ncbi:hypothetical protein Moror_13667 [Moniliophthora roreri MCA 2997]|uniref:Ubiquitin 3 binding protein But2 C-terminal domain-containing protein n=2 Tax=Moniliophthora roreri TaxID=221103 RepID=V2YFF3_MONRO|nr:hypothetical protein Moror_13667 [Moniliophthora roreri MCA 2997]KAI3600679.1 hypothetical protein WG66_014173 [Moniliophthora roreri]